MDIFIFVMILLGLIVVMVAELVRPSLAFFTAIVLLLAFQIIDPKTALSGFANPQLSIIILLLIVSDVFKRTAITDNVLGFLFKRNRTARFFYFKMITSVGILSAWFNNTPLVAVYLPYVHQWAVQRRVAPSRFLIPLSYASILGGGVTLIGTSTNLIVNGLLYEAEEEIFGFFEFAFVGGIMLFIGLLYLLLIAPRILPNHRSVIGQYQEESRAFFIETIVKKDSPIVGQTVRQAGLRNLDGVFLVQIIRDEEAIAPVSPSQELLEDDVLIFTGDKTRIQDLMQPKMGLALPKECDFHREEEFDWVEAVVAPNASIVGKTVKDISFRGSYDGAILAIHRNGDRMKGKLGDHVIKVGDVLLVIAGKDFEKRVKRENNFYLLSKQKEMTKPSVTTMAVLGLGFAVSIALTFVGVSLFISLCVLLMITSFYGLLDFKTLPKIIDFDLILVIAFGLALGKGFTSLGITEDITLFIHANDINIHPIYLLGLIFIVTNIFAAFITSKAAVALLFPVCLAIAQAMGFAVMPIVLSMTFGAVANFLTPVGYQTNMMVYGPGAYRFRDYFKVGTPLVLIYWVVSTLLIYFFYFK